MHGPIVCRTNYDMSSDENEESGNGHLETISTKSALRKRLAATEDKLKKLTFTAKHLYAERVQMAARIVALEKAKPEEVLRANEVADKVMELFGFDPKSLQHQLEKSRDELPPPAESVSPIVGPQGKNIIRKRF